MRVFLIARQRIINPENNKLYTGKDLLALDGLRYGPVHWMNEIPNDYMEELITEFKDLQPDFQADEYELKIDKEIQNIE